MRYKRIETSSIRASELVPNLIMRYKRKHYASVVFIAVSSKSHNEIQKLGVSALDAQGNSSKSHNEIQKSL